jgi:hypothetical protein
MRRVFIEISRKIFDIFVGYPTTIRRIEKLSRDLGWNVFEEYSVVISALFFED